MGKIYTQLNLLPFQANSDSLRFICPSWRIVVHYILVAYILAVAARQLSVSILGLADGGFSPTSIICLSVFMFSAASDAGGIGSSYTPTEMMALLKSWPKCKLPAGGRWEWIVSVRWCFWQHQSYWNCVGILLDTLACVVWRGIDRGFAAMMPAPAKSCSKLIKECVISILKLFPPLTTFHALSKRHLLLCSSLKNIWANYSHCIQLGNLNLIWSLILHRSKLRQNW